LSYKNVEKLFQTPQTNDHDGHDGASFHDFAAGNFHHGEKNVGHLQAAQG